ncbi:MAG: CDP-alcohol phosphatidyltransferase family protein [Bacteroidota bacterium]
MYEYRNSLKSNISDELINTYVLRPIAGLIVWLLYRTPVTPNQVTIASTIAGLAAAVFYLRDQALSTAIAGLLVTLKDVLDSADGQLARAKEQYSRIGRFLDSIGDFVVDVAVFGAIGWVLFTSSGNPWMLILAFLGLTGITLRVSYHVFYQTSFLHLEEKYPINRLTEEIMEEDLKGDRLALKLQRIFLAVYGWQDRLMVRVDLWCRRGQEERQFLVRWYSDPLGLRISGLLGIGTELFLLMVCSLFNQLLLYCYVNLIFMNGILVTSLVYRRQFLYHRLQLGDSP